MEIKHARATQVAQGVDRPHHSDGWDKGACPKIGAAPHRVCSKAARLADGHLVEISSISRLVSRPPSIAQAAPTVRPKALGRDPEADAKAAKDFW